MSLRDGLAIIVRRLPERYRTQRLLDRLDRHVRGTQPTARVPMHLGYTMEVDVRSRTEVFAFWTGHYDTDLVRAAVHFLPTDGVAFDVGANIGFWAVPLAQRGQCYAFEPVPQNADRLARNAVLNGVTESLHIERIGLSDAPGSARVTLREDFERGAETGNAAIVIADGHDDRFAQLDIPLDTLDGVVARLGVPRLDILKVDVEGHEDFVLRGARATLRDLKPIIFIEWNVDYFDRRGADASLEVDHALDGLDYRVLRRGPGGWAVADSFVSDHPIDDLILVPSTRLESVLNGLSRL